MSSYSEIKSDATKLAWGAGAAIVIGLLWNIAFMLTVIGIALGIILIRRALFGRDAVAEAQIKIVVLTVVGLASITFVSYVMFSAIADSPINQPYVPKVEKKLSKEEYDAKLDEYRKQMLEN